MHGEVRLDEGHDWCVRVALITGLRELTPEIEERILALRRQGYRDHHVAAELLRKQLGCSAHNTGETSQ